MEEISIKKVEPKDADFLSEVAIRAYKDHYLDLWYDEGKWYLENHLSAKKFSSELQDQNTRFYISYIDDSPVGFLKLNIDAPIAAFENDNSLELERIYLNKEAEGKGIGKQLVELTFKIAEEYNKDLVWLKAMDTSEGPIAFYTKMGFRNIGTHRLRHQLMREELRGMLIMGKMIKGI